jgi:NTP pyrophosphatase (non-canonical NTP hydrolase)
MSGTEPGLSQEIEELRNALRQFAQQRDWGQFHSPKNLATSLSIEAAEVLEHFQWLTEDQSRNLDQDKTRAVALEIADVLLYLVQLADKLGIDPLQAARDKLAINAARYPVDKARGSSRKYTDL